MFQYFYYTYSLLIDSICFDLEVSAVLAEKSAKFTEIFRITPFFHA